MKVRELIELLQKTDQDYVVLFAQDFDEEDTYRIEKLEEQVRWFEPQDKIYYLSENPEPPEVNEEVRTNVVVLATR
jgi:hypothetical protein